MERLFDLLKIVESVQLAPVVLEPEPMVFTGGVGAMGSAGSRGPGGADGKGDWANNRSGGFRNEENQVRTRLSIFILFFPTYMLEMNKVIMRRLQTGQDYHRR